MPFILESKLYRIFYVILIGIVLPPNYSLAETEICSTGVIQLPKHFLKPSPTTPKPPVNITADSLDSPKDGLLTLRGNVQLIQGGRTMLADKMVYQKNKKLFEAHTNVRVYSDNGDLLETNFLELNLDTGKGHTAKAKFKVANRKRKHKNRLLAYVAAYGTAKKVIFIDKHNMQLIDVDYANCLDNKGDILVTAKQLNLNVETGDMSAEKVKMRILRPNEHSKLIN